MHGYMISACQHAQSCFGFRSVSGIFIHLTALVCKCSLSSNMHSCKQLLKRPTNACMSNTCTRVIVHWAQNYPYRPCKRMSQTQAFHTHELSRQRSSKDFEYLVTWMLIILLPLVCSVFRPRNNCLDRKQLPAHYDAYTTGFGCRFTVNNSPFQWPERASSVDPVSSPFQWLWRPPRAWPCLLLDSWPSLCFTGFPEISMPMYQFLFLYLCDLYKKYHEPSWCSSYLSWNLVASDCESCKNSGASVAIFAACVVVESHLSRMMFFLCWHVWRQTDLQWPCMATVIFSYRCVEIALVIDHQVSARWHGLQSDQPSCTNSAS